MTSSGLAVISILVSQRWSSGFVSNNKLTNLSESPEPQRVPSDVTMTGEVPVSEDRAPTNCNDSMTVCTLTSNNHITDSVCRIFSTMFPIYRPNTFSHFHRKTGKEKRSFQPCPQATVCKLQTEYTSTDPKLERINKIRFFTVPDRFRWWSLWKVGTKTHQTNMSNNWLPVHQTQHGLGNINAALSPHWWSLLTCLVEGIFS